MAAGRECSVPQRQNPPHTHGASRRAAVLLCNLRHPRTPLRLHCAATGAVSVETAHWSGSQSPLVVHPARYHPAHPPGQVGHATPSVWTLRLARRGTNRAALLRGWLGNQRYNVLGTPAVPLWRNPSIIMASSMP